MTAFDHPPRTAALLLALALASPAAAQVAPDTAPAAPDVTVPDAKAPGTTARDTVRRWFDGFEFVPTAEHYARIGAELGPALIAIAADPAEHPVVRARAVSAMAAATDAATLAHLGALLDDPDAESLLRRKAALALAERRGEAAIDRLAQALTNAPDDVPLREACARALRGLGPAAHATRDALLRGETAPTVRGLLGAEKRIGID